jgi:hypothetical protein
VGLPVSRSVRTAAFRPGPPPLLSPPSPRSPLPTASRFYKMHTELSRALLFASSASTHHAPLLSALNCHLCSLMSTITSPPLPLLSGPKGPPPTPLHVTIGCSPSRWSATPRATVLRRRLAHGAHRRPPSPIDLQPNQEYCELPLCPLPLINPMFHSGSLSSAPPPTASPPLSSSPSVEHLVEPLSIKLVPIESSGARLAPQHHLARPLIVG